jgi:hypothetical protein
LLTENKKRKSKTAQGCPESKQIEETQQIVLVPGNKARQSSWDGSCMLPLQHQSHTAIKENRINSLKL